MDLHAPVTQLSGVGESLALKLATLKIHTLQDLIFHLPYRYEDRTRLVPLNSLRNGMQAMVLGKIISTDIKHGRQRMLLVEVEDQDGTTLTIRFFRFYPAWLKTMQIGHYIRAFGDVRLGPNGLEMAHPQYKVAEEHNTLTHLPDSLTPVYSQTAGITTDRISQLIEQTLPQLHAVEELLPNQSQYSLSDALQLLHRPPPDVNLASLSESRHPAQLRLAFEELLAQQLGMRQLRAKARAHPAPALTTQGAVAELLAHMPFKPTGAQSRVIQDVLNDLAHPVPMLRLVQGDVGSGKTLVAAAACVQAIASGHQAAFMAPTEILAEQHARNLSTWLQPLGISVRLHSGKQTAKNKTAFLEDLKAGDIQLAVGTHALFQSDVEFEKLGLVVVDEQHRFGVHQRLALHEKGEAQGLRPHQLIMTATPIPRTLAMSAYADLDTSIIDELPPGRTPVQTVVLSEERRQALIERVAHACAEGRQTYWVCTLIEDSDKLQAQAAETTAADLQTALPQLRIGLIHGRMKPKEKEQVMSGFKARRIDLLVATTVIEVGVDVPNASLMIIENAERLGLAQLHQLRGRVGRGQTASHCVLMYKEPLSELATQRLHVMRESNDGFVIAQRDLEIRGPGEVLGTRQTGLANMKVADLTLHADLLPAVNTQADDLFAHHPNISKKLIRRWLGEAERYAQV